MGKLIDMTGWVMTEHGVPNSLLTVLYRNEYNDKENKPLWVCQCQCGKQIIVSGKRLRNGNTKSCGCYQKEQVTLTGQKNKKDLINKKIGLLTIIEQCQTKKNNSILWKCQCKCGNICYFSTSELNQRVVSCGCQHRSIGETNIYNYLTENNYNFIYDKPYFKDLISKKGYICRYDFIILDKNNNPYRIIEFDGKQHIDLVQNNYFSQTPEEIQTNDKIKNDYAIIHKIPLVRIPYYMKNKISYEVLFGDTFLVSQPST